jgi:chromosome segregation ATPase
MSSSVTAEVSREETEFHRAATARLSREYLHHAGLKRELDAQARSLQEKLDRFVRSTAEETHRVSAGLDAVYSEFRELNDSLRGLREACENAERLCHDARLKRDGLRNSLREVAAETSALKAGLGAYVGRTQENAAPLEARLRGAEEELASLADERARLHNHVH